MVLASRVAGIAPRSTASPPHSAIRSGSPRTWSGLSGLVSEESRAYIRSK
jgi:hypothetical protein